MKENKRYRIKWIVFALIIIIMGVSAYYGLALTSGESPSIFLDVEIVGGKPVIKVLSENCSIESPWTDYSKCIEGDSIVYTCRGGGTATWVLECDSGYEIPQGPESMEADFVTITMAHNCSKLAKEIDDLYMSIQVLEYEISLLEVKIKVRNDGIKDFKDKIAQLQKQKAILETVRLETIALIFKMNNALSAVDDVDDALDFASAMIDLASLPKLAGLKGIGIAVKEWAKKYGMAAALQAIKDTYGEEARKAINSALGDLLINKAKYENKIKLKNSDIAFWIQQITNYQMEIESFQDKIDAKKAKIKAKNTELDLLEDRFMELGCGELGY